MLKLDAIKSEKIWGYELWIASTHAHASQKALEEFAKGFHPLLVKIIQANDTLSIQVHPDDKFAVELEGEGNRGKTECWYVLDAQEDAKLVYGLKGKYSEQELRTAIEENKLEAYLNFVNVKKGDFVYIPAGTVHAIGKGLRLLEVQQSCDLTYRLYDWGRGREVHVEKGLKVIKEEEMMPVAKFSGQFQCPYFELQTVNVNGGWSMMASFGKEAKDVQFLYVISSDGARIHCPEDNSLVPIAAEEIYALKPGEKITVEGKATVMKIKSK